MIAIYAKMYHYAKSYVKVNPVRLAVSLVFPQQNDAEFNIDIELRGVSAIQFIFSPMPSVYHLSSVFVDY